MIYFRKIILHLFPNYRSLKMTSKNVRFAEEPIMDEEDIHYLRARKRRHVEEDEIDNEPEEQEPKERKQQHTLDSDEEEETKYDRLDMNKVAGQEEATIEYDGNVKITAFNMKEDMEEGHFDDQGNFIFDKKQEDIKDAWLDGIDWNRVKQSAGDRWHKEDDTEADIPPAKLDEKAVYEKLLSILNDKETVAKALKRMNSEKGLSAAEERKRRWAAKKAGTKFEEPNAAAVAELTSLADSLVSSGHMEAYQLNKESISKLLEEITNKEGTSFDMFADDVQVATTSESKDTKEAVDSNATMWEFRSSDSHEIQGPFSTDVMIKKKDDGLFKDDTVVRRVGTESFYDVNRIDFDLYD